MGYAGTQAQRANTRSRIKAQSAKRLSDTKDYARLNLILSWLWRNESFIYGSSDINAVVSESSCYSSE